jgi:hypothetical protein
MMFGTTIKIKFAQFGNRKIASLPFARERRIQSLLCLLKFGLEALKSIQDLKPTY